MKKYDLVINGSNTRTVESESLAAACEAFGYDDFDEQEPTRAICFPDETDFEWEDEIVEVMEQE